MAQIAVCRLLAAAPAVARARLGTARPALALVPLRASSGGAGQITSDLMERMQNKIQTQLEAQLVEVRDQSGDGRHVEISVVAAAFEGKSAVNRQRLVYKAIWEELQDTVHAVDAMVVRTPAEAGL